MIKIYCDICEKQIEENVEGDLKVAFIGKLILGWGIWGEKAEKPAFNLDLCKECYESLKDTIENQIEFLREESLKNQ